MPTYPQRGKRQAAEPFGQALDLFGRPGDLLVHDPRHHPPAALVAQLQAADLDLRNVDPNGLLVDGEVQPLLRSDLPRAPIPIILVARSPLPGAEVATVRWRPATLVGHRRRPEARFIPG